MSEVLLSKSINVANQYRWDSEFYLKQFIFNENKLNNLLYKKFASYTNYIKKGIFDLSPLNYKEKGIPFIRTSEIKNPTIDFSTTVFLDKTVNKENCKTILKPNDLVFTKIGAYIGDVAKLPSNYTEYNFSQNVVGVSLKNKNQGAILLAFFLSKFGKLQILRSLMLSGQGKLELIDIRNYKIPDFSNFLINYFNKLFIHKEKLILKSQQLYTQAEDLLLAEVGLQDFSPSTEAVNIKSFAESFGTSGRLDAEYYQPKYEQVINKIKRQHYDNLKNLVSIKKSIEPGSNNYADEGLPFLRVADFSKQGLTEPQKYLTPHFIEENKKTITSLKPKKNTILFSKDGSVGMAYQLREDFNGITSGAILHLKIKDSEKLLPEYLTLVLNSELVQLQAQRDVGGSIILHWRVSEIEEVIVPIIPLKKQQQIAQLVEQSFALKAQSEQLLEVAKRAVEIAIEQDEATAIAYITEESKIGNES